MHLLAHRGLWNAPGEQNTLAALSRALLGGHGIETDLRPLAGSVVLSHDPPASGAQLTSLTDLVEYAEQYLPDHSMLALNIKADGLAEQCLSAVSRIQDRVFFFDMSAPELLRYLDIGLPVFARQSDVERKPICYEAAKGVWLDELREPWIRTDDIRRHLASGKRVAVVSSELHGRTHRALWQLLLPFAAERYVMLCTDLVDEAEAFFA